MPIINRLSSLFSADVHAILDRIEDPMNLLKASVRTMEEEIDRAELAVQRLNDERERNRRRFAEFESRLQQLDEELDVCFASSEDDLAKGLIRRKLELSEHLGQLTEKRVDLDARIDKQLTELGENRRQLERMREKLELLGDEQPRATTTSEPNFSSAVTERDVEVAYLKEKQRRAAQ